MLAFRFVTASPSFGADTARPHLAACVVQAEIESQQRLRTDHDAARQHRMARRKSGEPGPRGLRLLLLPAERPSQRGGAVRRGAYSRRPLLRHRRDQGHGDRCAAHAASAATFAEMVGALGISNRSTVVFYDQVGLFSAARGWWMMRVFGHDQAAVLDGGLPKWQAESRPLETSSAVLPSPVTFTPAHRPELVRDLGAMKATVADGSALILDARPRRALCRHRARTKTRSARRPHAGGA